MANVEKDHTLRHEPGIYFGMPEDEYHADTALGSTDIKLLATMPWVWQRNRLRPSTRRVTEDMKWGSALHCRVLEGKEAFDQRYAQKPRPEDWGEPGTDILVTVDDLKNFLSARSQPVSKFKKAELIEKVQEFLDAPPIFDVEMAKWEEVRRVDPDYRLDADRVQEIEDAVFFLESDEVISSIMKAGSLMGGAAEVSIFYETRGVRRKARFDYGLPPMGALTVSTIADLKSFAQFKGRDSEEAAKFTITDRDYDIQAIDYLNGFEHGRVLEMEGRVFGDEPFEGYTKAFFGAENVQWVWIMVHKDGGFQPVTMSFNRYDEGYASDQHFGAIEQMCGDAIENLLNYGDVYGFDALWPAPSRTPITISGPELPGYRRRY